MNTNLKNTLIAVIVALTIFGCKDGPGRHLQLGQWYGQKGLVDEAILEFREVTRLLPNDIKLLSRDEYEMLANAHYNLALMYTKKGWWEFALDAAESSFQLQPNNDVHELVDLIKKQIRLNQSSGSS